MERRAISNLSSSFWAKITGLRKRFPYFIVFLLLSQICKAQTAPPIEWQHTFGGPSVDETFSIIETADGGFTAAGYTNGASDNYIPNFHGHEDAWVIRLNSIGQQQWNECHGGSLDEEIKCITQTKDSGYICAIRTESFDGEVLNSNNGVSDAWIVKVSARDSIEWQDDLGGTNYNDPLSIIQLSDGNYIFSGFTRSINGDVTGHHGTLENADAWVVKLDSTGQWLWGKCLGGTGREWASSILQTPDSGFIFAGFTNSPDDDVTGFKGGASDFWVVKLNDTAGIQWQKCYGGDSEDYAESIKMTTDGGFIVAGATHSADGDVTGYHGGEDAWVLKLNDTGKIEWQKCLGGSGDDKAWSVIQTSEGGYLMAGTTTSNDGDVTGNHGGGDAWLVKLSSSGEIEWQRCFGGSKIDYAYSVIQSRDGGYVFAGSTVSDDGDITKYYGTQDAWIVKLAPSASVNDAPDPSAQTGLSLSAELLTNSANLSLAIPTAPADIRIDVTNILGVKLEQLEEKTSLTGLQNVPIDLTHLTAGAYFITVSACGLTQTIPVAIIK